MPYYVELNTRRLRARKGPKMGRVTLFATRRGRIAVTDAPLGIGRSVRVPRWLVRLLAAAHLAYYQASWHERDPE